MGAREDSGHFGEIMQRVDRVYDLYARSVGLSSTGMYLLHLVYYNDTCTQAFLAEQMILPKQTVHSIVKLYQKQGLLELVTLPEDKRSRGIRLTQEGLAFAQAYFPAIAEAERRSIEQFSPEERRMLFALLERYVQVLSQELP